MVNEKMIEVKHLYKSFEDKEVLKDINAVFENGKTNLIIGQSGSGKTVLMKNLVGLFNPTKGEVLYDGRNFVTMSKREKIEMRREMGMIFQSAALFDSINVLENVMFPLDMFSTMTYNERVRRAQECLDRVNLIDAQHKSDVVVAPDPACKGNAVQPPVRVAAQAPVPADPADPLDSAADQRKHCDRIEPHQVKVVADYKTAQCEHAAKRGRKCHRSGIALVYIPGKCPPAQPYLQKDHQIHEITDIRLRYQGDQEVERACQIICVRRPEIVAQAGRERIQQSLAGSQFLMKIRVERKILMEGINDQDRPVA